MINNFKPGGIIFIYMFLLFFLNGCTTPEENAIKKGPDVYTVEIKDMKFQPEELTVKKGDTVIWVNHDIVTHCVTEEKTKAWTSANIAAGKSWKMVVKDSADYYCAIHQVMKGKINVE
jgi:plastocyanin